MGEPRQRLRRPRDPSTLRVDLNAVVADLSESSVLSEQSLRRLQPILERFGWFAESSAGVDSLAAITSDVVDRFVRARTTRERIPPSPATMHARRSAVRLLFRTGRQLGLCVADPTVDIMLPARSSLRARPLTDDEVGLCRSASLHSLDATRLPGAWALAEATVRSGELAAVRVADVDLDEARVWIAGSARTESRWGTLSAWGCKQLHRRLNAIGESPLVVYAGSGTAESQQASSCQAIHETLLRTGLSREADVRPVSVAAWAGRLAFEQTQQIDEAARVLGVRSLDRAAAIIGWDWSTGETP
jgi:integrase/recombinase XerC